MARLSEATSSDVSVSSVPVTAKALLDRDAAGFQQQAAQSNACSPPLRGAHPLELTGLE